MARNATAITHSKRSPLPPLPSYDLEKTVTAKQTLAAGESARFTYTEKPDDLTLTIAEVVGDVVDLFILGYVDYVDENGIGRRTAFCRRYNPETKRFELVEDPDYEYAD